VAREFLGEHGIAYTSWDVAESDGRRAWIAAGRPPLPTLTIGSRVVPLMLPRAQIAAELGLEVPEAPPGDRLMSDLAALQEAWVALLDSIAYDDLRLRTRWRGDRSLLELVAHVFYVLETVVEAWSSGVVEWEAEGPDPAEEAAVAARLTDRDAVVAYAAGCVASWRGLSAACAAAAHGTREVTNPGRGTVTFGQLLLMARQHAAQHLQQATHTLDGAGIPHRGRDPRTIVPDLALPDDPF
jgi:hypothetical protein